MFVNKLSGPLETSLVRMKTKNSLTKIMQRDLSYPANHFPEKRWGHQSCCKHFNGLFRWFFVAMVINYINIIYVIWLSTSNMSCCFEGEITFATCHFVGCCVAGDGPGLRDFVIQHGVVKPLLKFVSPNVPVSLISNRKLLPVLIRMS